MKLIQIAVVLLVGCGVLSAETGSNPAPDRIAVLHLKKVGARITLDSLQVVAGKLKTPRHQTLREGDLRVSVRSLQGSELSRTAIPDPSLRRLEYVDEQGQLQTKLELRDSVHFTVRLPYDSTGYWVDFQRLTHPSSGNSANDPQLELVGSVVIATRESGHD